MTVVLLQAYLGKFRVIMFFRRCVFLSFVPAFTFSFIGCMIHLDC